MAAAAPTRCTAATVVVTKRADLTQVAGEALAHSPRGTRENFSLFSIRLGPDPAPALVFEMQPLHPHVLASLGAPYELFYNSSK